MSDGGRAATVAFTGERTALFGLLLRGYLLMLPTAGIYRFWVTTAKRHFYWQNTVIDGDPLEYTGSPLQLLVGFLFAIAFFLPIYVAFFYLSTQTPEIVLIGYAIVGAIFWFLMGYAFYRARDFRLSRTLWRGIRFDLRGNAWAYATRRFLWSILMIPTLGLVYPFMAASLWRYRYRHTWFGDRQFEWKGSWKTLAGPYYRTYLLIAVLYGAAVIAAIPGERAVPVFILLLFVAIIASVPLWFGYRAREATRMFSAVAIGVAQVKVHVRARAMIGQFLLYCLGLAGASVVLSVIGGIVATAFLGSAITLVSATGEPSAQLAQLLHAGWPVVTAIVVSYLLSFASFALMGEVFLGYGYWMLIARGAVITNVGSLRGVRGSGEDGALVGEGLADALNVGAY